MYPGVSLDIRKLIVLLLTLTAYNKSLVHCKVYSSSPRECLHTEYGETYVYLSIDPAPYQKNPMKNKTFMQKCQSLLLGEI